MDNLNIKKWAMALSAVLVLAACQPADQKEQEKAVETKPVETEAVAGASEIQENDKIGYALGAKMATFIKTDIDKYNLPNINKESVAKGFTDALAGSTKMDDQEIQAQFMAFQQQIQAAQQKAAAEQQQQQAVEAEKAKKDGAIYLAANAKKEGVVTTESGLQYSVVTAGKEGAAKPKATDNVRVHYTGTFTDGTKFDSSVDRGQPATFPLNRVIKGWTEGLQLMSVGSKFHFVIPGDLAYGPNGKPGAIPGNAVLEFDVELLAINPDAKKEESKK